MAELANHYKELRSVNKGLAKLLSHNNSHDAPVNALILLDLLASEIPQEIDESLESIKPIFNLGN